MVKEQYRKEMEQVKLNDEQMARLVEMMAAPPVQKVRHVGRTILAAAVLAALLSVAALAVSPTLRQTLESLLGDFAPYSQAVEGVSVEDQGIRVSVVKAIADEAGGSVYLEFQDITGDRLTEGTVIPDMYPISYDPETHTLLAEYKWREYFGQINEDGSITIPIHKIQGGEYFEGIQLPQELLDADNVLNTEIASEAYSHGSDDKRVVLAPEQTPRKLDGADNITLSSMGFDEDGLLHIQIKIADDFVKYISSESHYYFVDLSTLHPHLKDQYQEGIFALNGLDYQLRDGRYLDFVVRSQVVSGFEDMSWGDYLPKEAYQDAPVLLEGWIATREQVEGDWTLTFPLHFQPSQTVAVGQEVNTKCVESADFSVMSTTLKITRPTGQYYAGLPGLPLTVYRTDGTHITVADSRCVHPWTEEEPWVLDRWEYAEPFAPDEVAAFSLGYWYIPLQKGRALPGYWLTELPD